MNELKGKTLQEMWAIIMRAHELNANLINKKDKTVKSL